MTTSFPFLSAGQQFYRKIGGVEYSGVFDGTNFVYATAKYTSPSAVAMAMANAHYKDTKPHYINGWNVIYIKNITTLPDGAVIHIIYLKALRTVTPKRPRDSTKPKTERKPKAAPKPESPPKPKSPPKPEPEPEDAPPPPREYHTAREIDDMLEVLGLTRIIIGASADKRKTIRAAMRAAALRHHPDKVGAMGNGDMMKRINAAYDALIDLYA